MTDSRKEKRLKAAISGEAPDRIPVSLWRHWPIDDLDGKRLARATLLFQRTFDFDFIKVTPNANFSVAQYGAQAHWAGNTEGTYEWKERVITQADDWLRLKSPDVRAGLLGEVLKANSIIGRELNGEAPFIQTIFNPLSQAKYLAGERLLSDLREHPKNLESALRVLTDTTLKFIAQLKKAGVAGIFLAVQHASFDLLTEAEYARFGEPYDLEILGAVKELWLNVVHLHGQNVMFERIGAYPAQVINWHDVETPPSLAKARGLTKMALLGGLSQWQTMVCGTPADAARERAAALEQTGGRKFILGTGCVTPIIAPVGNLFAAAAGAAGS